MKVKSDDRKWNWSKKNLSESESKIFDIQPAGRRLRNTPSRKERLPYASYQKSLVDDNKDVGGFDDILKVDLVCIVAIAVGISLLLHSASMKSSWCISMCFTLFHFVSICFNVFQCCFNVVSTCFDVLQCFSMNSSWHISKLDQSAFSHLGSGVGVAHDSITVHYCVPEQNWNTRYSWY